jgi:chromosome segregation ATPase
MSDVSQLMQELQIEDSVLTPEDLRLLQSGVPVSESEDDYSEGLFEPSPRGKIGEPRIFQEFERRLRESSAKILDLQRDKASLQEALEVQRLTLQREMRARQEETLNQLDDLSRRYKKLKAEAPFVTERVDSLKTQLRHLLLTAEQHSQLKGKPESQMDLKEWLQLRVYEVVETYKRGAEGMKTQLEAVQADHEVQTDKLARTERELVHVSTSSSSQIKELSRQYQDLSDQNSALHRQLEQTKKQLQENRDKVQQYDQLARDMRQLTEDKARTSHQIDAQVGHIAQLTRRAEETELLLEGTKVELSGLRKDKSYLGKQNSQLLEKVQRLEERYERLETEASEAKLAAQNYLNKLLDVKSDRSASFEDRFTKELAELRDRHAAELEDLKRNLTEVHERRVEYLKEAKEEAEFKVEQLTRDLKEKSEAFDELTYEGRGKVARLEEMLSEVRSELRMKTEAVERTHNTYEDTLAALRHSKAENEMLRDKVDVLKQEFYKAEHKNTHGSADIRAQLAVAKEQLRQYALIEQELDEAIKQQQVAGIQAPTTSQRRIQQSLQLAKQLKEKQDQCEALESAKTHLEGEVEKLSNEVHLSKRLLSHTDQPYAYLVAQIEEKERESQELRRQLKQSSSRLSTVQAEMEVLQRRSSEQERDLQDLLSKRQALDSLQTVLKSLLEDEDRSVDARALLQKLGQQPKKAESGPGWFSKLKKMRK